MNRNNRERARFERAGTVSAGAWNKGEADSYEGAQHRTSKRSAARLRDRLRRDPSGLSVRGTVARLPCSFFEA